MPMLPIGKLEPRFLQYLLKNYTHTARDQRVLVGPSIGEDATVIDFGATCLVAKTDPITFATDEIGWYAVQVNSNDIAVAGGLPRWFLATVLLPQDKTDEALVESIFSQLAEACAQLGISLCGGHTEVTYGLNRPIVVGQMLGEVPRGQIVSTGGGQPGDALLLSKGIAIEATAIIAREKHDELSRRHLPDFLASCRELLHSPGISVLREARLAMEAAPIHAMHDPTEGGLATGLWELATASNTGVIIEMDAIPILPQTKILCDEYELDLLGVIASGALLLAVEPGYAAAVLDSWKSAGIEGAIIGQLVEKGQGLRLVRDGTVDALPQFRRDEITRLFDQ